MPCISISDNVQFQVVCAKVASLAMILFYVYNTCTLNVVQGLNIVCWRHYIEWSRSECIPAIHTSKLEGT